MSTTPPPTTPLIPKKESIIQKIKDEIKVIGTEIKNEFIPIEKKVESIIIPIIEAKLDAFEQQILPKIETLIENKISSYLQQKL